MSAPDPKADARIDTFFAEGALAARGGLCGPGAGLAARVRAEREHSDGGRDD